MPRVKAGHQISVKGNIDKIFDALAKGHKKINLPNGRTQIVLPNGTTVTKYPGASGFPTLQVNQAGKITKIRILQ